MAKLSIVAGATSQTVNIFIQDSSSTTGAGLTGLAYNTASLVAYYALPKAAAAAITLATLAAVTSAYSSGGFKEIDATNMPGWYRFDIPDAALASGRFVAIHFKGATNMAPCPLEIELTATNNQDAVRGGMTALPNAAAEAAGGLFTRGTGAGQINQDANGRIDANAKAWIGGTIPAVNTTGVPLVDTKYVTGTLQTARDIGASVLISSGTGTGQLDVTSGVIKANLVQILATALTETAGQIAAGFKQFFNIASPTSTMNLVTAVTTTTNLTNASPDTSGTTTLLSRLSSARAGYLDNLNVGGAVASSADVTGLNINTRCNLLVPNEIETPDSSTQTYKIRLHLYDEVGNMEAPDSTPTVTLTNAAGTDRSSRLSSASNPSSGVYTWDYTATAGDAEEQLIWLFSIAEGSVTRTYPANSYVVEQSLYRFSSTDRTNLNAIKTKTDQFVFTNTNKVDAAFNAAGDLPQACADKVWSTTTRAITDKSGFSLSSGGVQAIWDALTSALTTAGSIGKKLVDSVTQTGDAYARLGAPAGASVSADIAAVKTETAAIKAKTDSLTYTVANQVDVNVVNWKGATAPAMTGDAYARLGAPAGASIAADIAAISVGSGGLDAAGVRAAIGMASANLDTQLADLPTNSELATALAAADDAVLSAVAGVQSDTNDIQTRIPAALTGAGNMKVDVLAISGSTTAADNLKSGGIALVPTTCASGSTTTSIVTNLTEATDDHYNGRVITFTSGALAGQATSISDYNGTTKTLTVIALTEAPANTDSFVIS